MVPAGSYKSQSKAVKTFGVHVVVVVSVDMAEADAYAVVKSVFDSLDAIRRLHPALRTLDAKQMMRPGATAPLHKGAEKYYREKGMM